MRGDTPTLAPAWLRRTPRFGNPQFGNPQFVGGLKSPDITHSPVLRPTSGSRLPPDPYAEAESTDEAVEESLTDFAGRWLLFRVARGADQARAREVAARLSDAERHGGNAVEWAAAATSSDAFLPMEARHLRKPGAFASRNAEAWSRRLPGALRDDFVAIVRRLAENEPITFAARRALHRQWSRERAARVRSASDCRRR